MKRITVSSLFVVLFVVLSAKTQAQEQVTVLRAVHGLTDLLGIDVQFTPAINPQAIAPHTNGKAFADIIKQLVAADGYTNVQFSADGKNLFISKSAAATAVPAQSESYQDYITRENNRIIAESSAFIAANTGYGNPGGYYNGNYAWDPVWYAKRQRRFEIQGVEGGLKATGPTKGIEIFVGKCKVADAEEIDGHFNQKAVIPANGPVTLTVVRVSDDRAYDEEARPASQAENEAVGGRHFTIRIRPALLNRGYVFDRKAAQAACRPE
jgi:hypothetical protein